MRVAVVGVGTAGSAAALLLARDGHEVSIVERAAEPSGVGAGILLQALGQRVLDELGLAAELEDRSTPVRRIDARTKGERRVLDFGYDDLAPGSYGWGVHRGALFDLLLRAVRAAGIPITTGVQVTGLRPSRDGWGLATAAGDLGPFDLVVGADGARSRLRRASGLASKDVGYPYGVIWSVVPDPDHLAGDVLHQRYDGTRIMLGVLPTGLDQASLFWSCPTKRLAAVIAAGPQAWVERARPFAGGLAVLVERVADQEILDASYRDVVVRSPVLVHREFGIALIGDAAHAMSPQLGLGASLALADAWSLAACLRAHRGDLPQALLAHAASRAAHVRYYTWCSRLMTPVFQSDLVPIGWGRDSLLGPIGRIPWVRHQFVKMLMGDQTSPWSRWEPPAGPDNVFRLNHNITPATD